MEREALKALLRDKDAMEAEMAGISEALSADNLGGVRTPVIDAEGYPRADIDVHTTLTLRNRLARLNSDHCELMGRIEAGLRGVFTPSQGQTSSNAAVPPAPPPPCKRRCRERLFVTYVTTRRSRLLLRSPCRHPIRFRTNSFPKARLSGRVARGAR